MNSRTPPAPPAPRPQLVPAHALQPEPDAGAPVPNAHAVVVLFGDQVVRTHATVGEAIGAPMTTTPVGSRVVYAGLVRARLTHAVDPQGRTYAGWMLCNEPVRRAG